MDIFEQIANIQTDARLIPSWEQSQAIPERILAFIHIPKCGGINFEYPLRSAMAAYYKPLNISHIAQRISFANIQGHQQALALAKNPGCLASHEGLPIFESIDHEHLDFVSFFREPFERCLSHYQYQCMRQNSQASTQGFSDFFRQDTQQNFITRNIHQHMTQDELLSFIEQRFYICAPVAKIDECLSHCLSRYHLPNVLKNRLNTSMAAFTLDSDQARSLYEQTFKNLNLKDYEFYQHFSCKPILPKLPPEGQAPRIQAHTQIICAQQSQRASHSRDLLVDSQTLLQFINLNYSKIKGLHKLLEALILSARTKAEA